MRARRWIAACLALMLGLAALPAAAETAAMELEARPVRFKSGQSFNVYTGPGKEWGRAGDGKAKVSTNGGIEVFGRDGDWLMITYRISGDRWRVGWIKAKAPSGSGVTDLVFDPVQAVVTGNGGDVEVTDDPRHSNTPTASLRDGLDVRWLGTWYGSAYIEWDTADGPRRGFVASWDLRPAGLWHMEGLTLVVEEGVTSIGTFYPEPDEEGNVDWDRVAEGDIVSLDLRDVREVRLPSTLRHLWSEALCYGDLDRLTLPEGLETVGTDALLGTTVGTLNIPSTCTEARITWGSVYGPTIREVALPNGSGVFSVRNGALFTADGKTLLYYPSGRTEPHYDVPRGTERIAGGAVGNRNLKTVSLPIGLKAIEAYAFSCDRLQALAVPLTVTELDPNAFVYCVSLENLSLPAGLKAERTDWAMYYPDAPIFRGDNGDTATRPETQPSAEDPPLRGVWVSQSLSAVVLADGTPLYSDEGCTAVARTLPAGAALEVQWLNSGVLGVAAVSLNGMAYLRREDVALTHAEEFFRYSTFAAKAGTRWWASPLTPAQTAGTIASDWSLSGAGNGWRAFFGALFTDYSTDPPHLFFLPDLDLTREHTGDSLTLGIAVSDGPLTAVPLRAEPYEAAGTVLTLQPGCQVRVTEERDGWLRVTAVAGDGWLPAGSVRVVPQDPE